jgi:hypothetical protein
MESAGRRYGWDLRLDFEVMNRAGKIDTAQWDYGGVHHGYHRERTEERIAGVSRGRGSLSDNVTGFITTSYYHRART